MAHLTRLDLGGPCGKLAADAHPGTGLPIVYLHGLASARNGTKGQRLLELAERRDLELLRVDLRGHGESAGSLDDATISGFCADVATALDHTGRAIVVGSSLGGLVGAWAAARDPDRVAALALIAPAFGMLEGLAHGHRLAGGAAAEVTVGPHVVEDARRFDESALPAQLTMPVWIVQGEHDEVVPTAATRRVFAAIPGPRKRMWVVPRGAHCLEGHLEEVFGSLACFLEQHRGG